MVSIICIPQSYSISKILALNYKEYEQTKHACYNYLVHGLLKTKHVIVELVLQLFIRVVDTKLLVAVQGSKSTRVSITSSHVEHKNSVLRA